MPPIVVDIMTGFRAALLRQEQLQMVQMAAHWRDVENALLGLMEGLAADIDAERLAGRSVAEWKIRRMGRFQELLRQARIQLAQFNGVSNGLIATGQRTLAQLGIDQASQLIRAAAGIDIAFDVLPIEAVQNMVGLAGNGAPLRALLDDAAGEAAQRMVRELVRSTALGRNPRLTARAMQQGLRGGLNRALNIARTEQLRVYREASRQQYEASGVVQGFRRLATKDERTCPACLMADGEQYEVTDTLREHPSGRCAMVPIVIGLPPAKWQTGSTWFRQQPAATQRSILGPGRYAAWKAGKYDLDQLVSVRRNTTWGDSVQATPLAELQNS